MTETLARVLDTVWEVLAAHIFAGGTHRPWATLATMGADGAPRLRHVALRSARREEGVLEVYSDARARKVAEIAAEPKAGLLVWQPEARVQLRLSGRAEVVTGAAVLPLWEALPPEGRLNYAHEPAPGVEIPAGGAYGQRPDPAYLALIRLAVAHVDYVSLAESGHRRAEFARRDGWAGRWLSP